MKLYSNYSINVCYCSKLYCRFYRSESLLFRYLLIVCYKGSDFESDNLHLKPVDYNNHNTIGLVLFGWHFSAPSFLNVFIGNYCHNSQSPFPYRICWLYQFNGSQTTCKKNWNYFVNFIIQFGSLKTEVIHSIKITATKIYPIIS